MPMQEIAKIGREESYDLLQACLLTQDWVEPIGLTDTDKLGQMQDTLAKLNNFAASDGWKLSDEIREPGSDHVETTDVADLVFKKFADTFVGNEDIIDQDLENIAKQIYGAALRAHEANQQKQKELARRGHYTTDPLHTRALFVQMEDHDINRLMPKSHGNVEVFTAIDQFDPRALPSMIGDPTKGGRGINGALADENTKHIMIPVGPGHYRGVYISKPEKAGDKYKIEIFDPFGEPGAHALDNFVVKLMGECGIAPEKLDIRHTEQLAHAQKDGYACGDFTAAFSHLKMKEFAKSGYDATFVEVLEKTGNEDGALRAAMRSRTQGLDPVNVQSTKPPVQKHTLPPLPPLPPVSTINTAKGQVAPKNEPKVNVVAVNPALEPVVAPQPPVTAKPATASKESITLTQEENSWLNQEEKQLEEKLLKTAKLQKTNKGVETEVSKLIDSRTGTRQKFFKDAVKDLKGERLSSQTKELLKLSDKELEKALKKREASSVVSEDADRELAAMLQEREIYSAGFKPK